MFEILVVGVDLFPPVVGSTHVVGLGAAVLLRIGAVPTIGPAKDVHTFPSILVPDTEIPGA